MTKRKLVKVVAVRTIGNALILWAIVGMAFTFWPILSSETWYRFFQIKNFLSAQSENLPQSGFGQLLGQEGGQLLRPKDTTFGLVVEKIGANAPVIANVDATNRRAYEQALKKGVAHAAGTVFPGQKGVSYLFAHSTQNVWDVPRYNAIFYLLREMKPGDRIVTYFGGVRYDYIVSEVKITEAKDISYFRMQTDESILVLQTCHPPGTTWKRLLIIGRLVSNVQPA